MNDLPLYLWDISVAIGIFGYGMLGTRLFGLKRCSLAVAGVVGISLWIALGGVLNLLHLLRPAVFFTLAATGFVFLVVDLQLRRKDAPVLADRTPFSLPAKLAVATAALLVLTLIVGVMRVRHWGHDDLEGYVAIGIKAAQNHALQPEPFSERRLNVGVGAGNFLDALMFATGDMRAMDFIDSGFGFGLYALALWALGRRWKVPPVGIAFVIFCVPLAPLCKINLTIIYLSAAGLLALLLLLTDAPEDEPISPGRIVALGLIVGALLTTKTPNIVFILPMLAAFVLLYRLFHTRRSPLLPLVYALLVAFCTFVPWAIANKPAVGTYLYPVLGLGNHVSAYHLIWPQPKIGSWQQMVLLTVPNLTLLLLCFAIGWNFTRGWAAPVRSAVLAYIAAAIVALPVCMRSLGGQDADRYTAPLVMPVYLLTLLLGLAAFPRLSAFWRSASLFTLLAVGSYLWFFDVRLMWLFETKIVLYEAFGKLPRHRPFDLHVLTQSDIQREFDYGARIQSSMPPGATALDISRRRTYHFDFRRNTIFTADIAGMASPPPGLPLDSPAAAQRQYLVSQGIDYLIFERDPGMACEYNSIFGVGDSDWPNFLKHQRRTFDFHYLFTHEVFAHQYGPWGIPEFLIACHERGIAEQIVDTSPQVYNDGTFVVARLR